MPPLLLLGSPLRIPFLRQWFLMMRRILGKLSLYIAPCHCHWKTNHTLHSLPFSHIHHSNYSTFLTPQYNVCNMIENFPPMPWSPCLLNSCWDSNILSSYDVLVSQWMLTSSSWMSLSLYPILSCLSISFSENCALYTWDWMLCLKLHLQCWSH